MHDNDDDIDYYQFSQLDLKTKFNKAIQILLKVSPSSHQVKQYNKFIIQQLKQYKNLDFLTSMLIEAEGQNSRCSLIISFIAHYLKIQVKLGIQTVRHDKVKIYQKIKSIFFCQSISEKHKKMLQRHFSEYISNLTPEFVKIRRQLCDDIVKYFLNQNNITTSDLSNILYLIEAVLTPSIQSDSLRVLQQSLLMNFIRLSLHQIRQVDLILSKNQKKTQMSQQEQRKIIWASKIHKVTQLLFISAKNEKVILLKQNVMISSQFANICVISLLLSKDKKSFILDHNQLQLQLLEQINNIKIYTLRMMQDSLKFLLKSKKNLSDLKYLPILETVKFFLQNVIISAFSKQFQYPEKSLTNQQIVKYTLVVLSQTTQIPCLLDFHTQIRDLVLFQFCLPVFITTEKDKELTAQDYCEFKQKIVDHDNSYRNIQQAAAACLQAYADNIYGTVPYLVKSLINLMDFQLTADPQYYQNIPQALINSKFFKNYQYFDHIQVSFCVLSILSYYADHREDIGPNVQEFIVRRQVFFSRIDVPTEIVVAFFHFCSYYLQNFYELILEGRANSSFHQSLLFHAIQVVNYCYDPNIKDFANNDKKKIGLQVLDYISNAIIQPFIFSAIFPEHKTQSSQMIISLIQKLCLYLDTCFNISVLENIFIDFVTRAIERHFPQSNNFTGMPQILRNQLCIIMVQNIIKNFSPHIKNQSVARIKILQLFSLLIRFSADPKHLIEISTPLFNYIIQKQYTFIDQLLIIIQLFVRRVLRQRLVISNQTRDIIGNCTIKCMKVCDDQQFQTVIFDLVINLGVLKICQQEIALCLIQVFQENLQQKDIDDKAQIIMQKVLYLLLQIAYSNFNLISSQNWIIILQKMLRFLRNNYVVNDTITIGKAVCICLCCFVQDPEGATTYLGDRNQGFWDCILDDQLKYSSLMQKKIYCLLLCNLMMKHSSQKTINDNFSNILRAVCIILYYIYQKTEISLSHEDQSDSNLSQSEKQQKKQWQQPFATMRENIFLSSLPDQRAMVKDLCLKVNEMNHQNFQKFIADLPIGIQNLVKNKIMMYREDSAVATKTKMRTIYKVKRKQQNQ